MTTKNPLHHEGQLIEKWEDLITKWSIMFQLINEAKQLITSETSASPNAAKNKYFPRLKG